MGQRHYAHHQLRQLRPRCGHRPQPLLLAHARRAQHCPLGAPRRDAPRGADDLLATHAVSLTYSSLPHSRAQTQRQRTNNVRVVDLTSGGVLLDFTLSPLADDWLLKGYIHEHGAHVERLDCPSARITKRYALFAGCGCRPAPWSQPRRGCLPLV